jgi:hypothetical protein
MASVSASRKAGVRSVSPCQRRTRRAARGAGVHAARWQRAGTPAAAAHSAPSSPTHPPAPAAAAAAGGAAGVAAQHLAAGAGRVVHGTGPVRAAAAHARPGAARRIARQGQRNVARQALHQQVFAGRELVEVGRRRRCRSLAVMAASKSTFLSSSRGGALREPHRAPAPRARAGGAGGLGLGFRRWAASAPAASGHLGVAEVGVKQLAEHQAVLLAADQHGLQRGARSGLRPGPPASPPAGPAPCARLSTGTPARRSARPKPVRLSASLPVRASPSCTVA